MESRTMSEKEFEQALQSRVRCAEDVLREHLPRREGMQRLIEEAMEYSLMAGGKRLRPILMLETYRMFGGQDWDSIRPFMAAIEMIHTYSLVHDDLPAMDNDRYRRGRETTWYVYGDAMGILAGDGLLNYAFETALRGLEGIHTGTSPLPAEEQLALMKRGLKAFSVLAEKAGIYGMIGGQVVDIMAERGIRPAEDGFRQPEEEFSQSEKRFRTAGQAISWPEGDAEGDRILFIHAHKTAALIQAAMMAGALLAGADEGQVAAVGRCAYDVGIAFQIQDDILDIIGDSRELGKATGGDARNGKLTYVAWRGLEQSQKDAEALSREAVEILESLPGDHGFLEQLILTLMHRRK